MATHRDFMAEVPAYRYELPCGHTVAYRQPVAPGDYGYCRSCRSYWLRDETVVEFPPRNCRRKLADSELAELVDRAILRNRVADLLLATVDGHATYGEHAVEDIAHTVGVSTWLVYQVAEELGIPLSQHDIREGAVA